MRAVGFLQHMIAANRGAGSDDDDDDDDDDGDDDDGGSKFLQDSEQ